MKIRFQSTIQIDNRFQKVKYCYLKNCLKKKKERRGNNNYRKEEKFNRVKKKNYDRNKK
jgi:hypothetical protein